jgi:hypothetical protein
MMLYIPDWYQTASKGTKMNQNRIILELVSANQDSIKKYFD